MTRIVEHLALALALGLLVGLERGWRMRARPEGMRVAGLRTFGLLGLMGGLAGTLARLELGWIAAILVGGCAALILIGQFREMRRSQGLSATSAVAGLVTIGLGVLVASGYEIEAVAAGAAMTLLLAARSRLHGWVQGLNETEIVSIARFAIIAGVVLPLLPDRRFGPLAAWNPRELWLVVVLVTGFSFAGYVANKRFGQTRGTLVAAAIGGLYSSTAVTAALAQRIREGGEPRIAAAGIALASTMMFARVLVLTALLAAAALPTLAAALAPAALASLLATLWLIRARPQAESTAQDAVPAGNPFRLLPALGFAALVGGMALLVRWAERYGSMGAAAIIIITGSFDVDAAIVTLHGLPPDTLAPRLAGIVLAIPVLLNMAFKAVVTIAATRNAAGWRAAAPLLVAVALIAATTGLLLL
jgi:uncharacterized membrane protein (DUF4010 family)